MVLCVVLDFRFGQELLAVDPKLAIDGLAVVGPKCPIGAPACVGEEGVLAILVVD